MPTYSHSLLLIEDDDYKAKAISDFVCEEWPHTKFELARSLNGAVRKISQHRFDVALVDMSLPTYDMATDRHGGGDPEGFAGEDILRFIESESPGTLTVVVTQLSEFSDASVTWTLEELKEYLQEEIATGYLGLVSYSGRHGAWRDSLRVLLRGVLQ